MSTEHHRLIAYHQTHRVDGQEVPLSPVAEPGRLSHLIVAAVHLTDGRVILNDHEHTDPYHDPLWAEVATVRARGVRVLAMVGGWAPGTMCKLDAHDPAEGDVERYYPLLRDFLRAHGFDGVDIDVEQDMSLTGVIELIDRLDDDFGPEFSIILAPVASALWGGDNLSGFDYEELYRQRGDRIEFLNAQLYSGYGSPATVEDYERIVDRGVVPVEKLVLGVVANPADANGFVDVHTVAQVITELCRRHPGFGGVDVWEYFRALPGGVDAPWEWVDLMRAALDGPAPAPETEWGLIPRPRSVRPGVGPWTLPARPTLSGPASWCDTFRTLVEPGTGLRFAAAERGQIRLETDAGLAPEAYRMQVDAEGLRVGAGDHGGLVHAISTIRQLLPAWCCGPGPVPGHEICLPFVQIDDAPRFRWRGMHLDVSRHFQPPASLFAFVDLLALHKLNVAHLHLTDDQGWRFEVRAYPRLTSVGGTRAETRSPQHPDGDGTPHGGFYRQDQLRALVAYAQERGITIVPEIDLPGHVAALLAAYPEAGESIDGHPFAVHPGGEITDVLHLTDATVTMVENIFTELLDVFPSRYIHVGGDECSRVQWRASTQAQELARARGLESVDRLQRWFTQHLRDWLARRGRVLIGWDEIIDDGPVHGAAVMAWNSNDPGLRALTQGHEVVMAPWRPGYFDHYQSRDPREPYAIDGHTPWQHVLRYDPAAGVPDEQLGRLLGVQGQLWTEYLPTAEQVQYMAFPRAAVLAEVAWDDGPRDEAEMEQRLRTHLARLDAAGVNYRPLDGPHPWQRGGTGDRSRPAGHGDDFD